jgi:AraC-like DNA-binding protein
MATHPGPEWARRAGICYFRTVVSNTPSWDFPRAPTAARMLVEAGRAHDVPADELLRGTKLVLEDLSDDDRLVEASQELAIVRNLVRNVGDYPGLGAESVRRYTVGSVGILGFALIASKTTRDALAVATRYLSLSSAFVRMSFEEDDSEARVVFGDEEIPADVRDLLVERDLAAIAQFVPLLLSADVPVSVGRVELRLPRDRADVIAAILSERDIRFDMPRNVIAFPSVILDLPLPQADSHTAEMCVRQCADVLDRRSQRHGTAAAVRSRVLRSPSDPPPMQAIADELNLDQRTLRRRLDSEGTSFRALVAEVRETLAIELLSNTGLTVEQVAVRLGYADTASFTHAFSRWRGKPPSHFRRKP